MLIRILWLCACACALAVASVAHGAERTSSFIDPSDNALDLSEWLLDRRGFLPVPIIITEPAVGNGGGVALLFFRESMRDAAARSKPGGHVTPPDIFAVMGAATENGTKVAGAGGMFTFQEDRWRYRGGIGATDVNLDFYGGGNVLASGDESIGYNLKGFISMQQALRRIGETNHFVGLRWMYLDLDSAFDAARPRPALSDRSLESRSSGLGVSWEHDSRDNFFTPSHGWKAAVESTFYTPAIGSDTEFQVYRAYLFAYMKLAAPLVLGMRLDARAARGDVPFYQKPYIDIRGVPAARYQDENAAVAELEARWNVTPRWAFIGFAGVGQAWGTRTSFGEGDDIFTKGVGVRYLIARRLGMYVGVDYAMGPEKNVFYIQAGSAWR